MADISDELDTLGRSIDNLSAAHVSGTEYRILSVRNGNLTAYPVDIDELTCPCNDNREQEHTHGYCAHIAKALLVHTEHKEPSEWAAQDLALVSERANNLIHDLRDAEDYLATEIETEAAVTATEEVRDGGEVDTPAEHHDDTPTATEEAEKLQEAFDSVIDDMVVEVSDDMIFFKQGFNTPDEWPYPGFADTFEAVTSPDPCLFVHDGSPDWADEPHELHDSKPGEYMKNAVAPADVDDYLEALAI